ncbi:MAG: hypothetical protein U9N58_05820 [Thermodesulfobacteriota bacterium]|nr:hypothetical protein [Thermodesulfobacteriota bacterium]
MEEISLLKVMGDIFIVTIILVVSMIPVMILLRVRRERAKHSLSLEDREPFQGLAVLLLWLGLSQLWCLILIFLCSLLATW